MTTIDPFLDPETVDPIDAINTQLIATAPIVRDPETGRHKILQDGGGYYTRSITGWVFVHNGVAVTVSVPSTLAALEARFPLPTAVAA